MFKNKIFVVSLIISIVLFAAFYLLPVKQLNAVVPFGGKILNVKYCTCSFNLLLTVGPPVGGKYMFGPGSKLYAYGQVYRAGPWVLGLAGAPQVCMMVGSHGCYPAGTGLKIIQVGTSL